MTAVEPQFRDFEFSNFFQNNRTKKHAYGSQDFHFMPVQKSRGTAHVNNNRPFYQFPSSHPNQQRKNQYQGPNAMTNKQPYHKNEITYNFDKFAKGNGNGLKNSTDKKNWIAYASTASESDSNSHIPSQLNGFKIVQNGNTVHDETEEDFDSANESHLSPRANTGFEKYASSVMVIGPSAKEISLPSFA